MSVSRKWSEVNLPEADLSRIVKVSHSESEAEPMKNDAKLGMLAGVLGVIVAAILFANAPPPDTPRPAAAVEPTTKASPTPQPVPTASTPPVAPETGDTLPATPVVRTRKDVDAQPTGRGGMEEP